MKFEFINCNGKQLYCKLYGNIKSPDMIVIVIPPFPFERNYSYIPIREWMEYLSDSGYTAISFDYPGTGESTGDFCQESIKSWKSSIHQLISIIKKQYCNIPIILHCIRFGALLSSEYQKDICACLLWQPYVTGDQFIKDLLRQKVASSISKNNGIRKTSNDYLEDIISGNGLFTEGYLISKKMYQSIIDLEVILNGDYGLKNIYFTPKSIIPNIPQEQQEKVVIPRPFFWNKGPYIRSNLSELFKTSCIFFDQSRNV